MYFFLLHELAQSYLCSGTMFIFRVDAGQVSITVTAASSLINKTEGLMGVFDQNADNDLKVRDGPTLSVDSSLEVIYADFGESCRCPPLFTLVFNKNDLFRH